MEIERKFRVEGDFLPDVYQSDRIVQGYLCSYPDRTVRVRIRGEKGYLTVKGPSDAYGWSRYEFEQEIPLSDAEEMLRLCEPGVIDKVRHLVNYGGHLWEVDIFHGENEGLVMAEIELASRNEDFERPAWLGKEVTGDRRYYNAMLSKEPYRLWSHELK